MNIHKRKGIINREFITRLSKYNLFSHWIHNKATIMNLFVELFELIKIVIQILINKFE